MFLTRKEPDRRIQWDLNCQNIETEPR